MRPRPFVPPPLAAQFWHLVRRPAEGVALVLRSQPHPARLAAGLAVAGALQGWVRVGRSYLAAGRLPELASLLGRAEWYTRYGGAFLLMPVLAVCALWIATALLLHAGGRLFRTAVRPGAGPAFRVTGVALFAGPILAALLPSPAMARLLLCVWLAPVLYQAARQVYRLSPLRAAALAALPLLGALLFTLAAAGLLQHLAPT